MQPDSQAVADKIQDEYDYIVVGSGAGGGPVAANLAKHGYTVLVLEAGGAEEPIEYSVPAFHTFASEQADLSWKYYVQHYACGARRLRDRINYLNGSVVDGEPRHGIFYPRAGTLGGCTAHYAMIFMSPHNSDWKHIEKITGDKSWAPRRMRRYFERLEHCEYVDAPWSRFLNCARHGYRGWLPTSIADPALLVRDWVLTRLVIDALQTCIEAEIWGIKSRRRQFCGWLASFFRPGVWGASLPGQLARWLENFFDPNDWGRVKTSLEGPALIPLAVKDGVRRGTRELIYETMQVRPDQLSVKLRALVTRIIFDKNNRATGVEFLEGQHLYRADPSSRDHAESLPTRYVRARREIILSAGAFNTPQLLMLSGIGPRHELEKHGIKPRIDLPGVGKNLQDRYEVGVVHWMEEDFELLKRAAFDANDEEFREWRKGHGPYASNGAVIAVIKRSSESKLEPDLFLFLVPGYFAGYHPRYSSERIREKNWFTWVLLKAHTNNTAGEVLLRSANPRDTPNINFHYFDEGNDPHGDDLDSVVAGIEFVRRMAARSASLGVEVIPGPHVQSRAALGQFVKDSAWGHHACGTCKIGAADDELAVLDSRFRVRGTTGLRVVDASVFPKIPGFFIVSAIYMIAEKASDVILEEAQESGFRQQKSRFKKGAHRWTLR
jgi:choline dehydrogenase